MKRILKYLPIILIFLFSLTLRIWKLSDYPAGLNADEAAIGYNAYSLIKTGKDEFGHSWPINFQSFNDFKPGFYFYLVLPWVAILGLNEWAVRLPSALLGSLTILAVYFLVKEIFKKEEKRNLLAAVASLLLAINPWHLHFSRGGWESNAAVFFIVLGVNLFFVSLKKPGYFSLCVLSLALSMFTYHSARVISPLLGFGLLLLYWKKIFRQENRRSLILSGVVGGILGLRLFVSMTGSAGMSRFSGVGIFADQGPFWRVNELRGQHSNPFSVFPKLVHNRYFEYGVQFLDNYLRHFSGSFLFISGDEIQRNKVPEIGQLFLIEIPFFLLGLYFLINKKPGEWKILFWWLMVAPVASALTFQSPHAIRSLNMVIPLVILTGFGLWNVLVWIQSQTKVIAILLNCSIVILFLWNFGFYLHQYYVHYPQTYPAAWEYGFKDLVNYVVENQNKYEEIYITNKYDQPYILFAFYLQYPPPKFQKEARLTSRDQYGFSTVENFGKYHFGRIGMKSLPKGRKVMVVGTPSEISDSVTILKRIYFKDGKTEAFRIVEN